MNCRAITVVVLLNVSSGAFADESWFERRWVWDEDATIRSMTGGHPESLACVRKTPQSELTNCVTLKEKLAEQLTDERDREWNVDSGIIEFHKGGEVHSRFVYGIRPIEEGKFELLIDIQGTQTYVVIQRTATGFCKTYGGDYTEPSSDERFYDCFKPLDAAQTAFSCHQFCMRKIGASFSGR
jgi:hypothetical protein